MESTGRIGVLLVGLNGATASTFAGSLLAMREGVIPVHYGTTGLANFQNTELCTVHDIQVGGWDYVPGSLTNSLMRHSIFSADVTSQIKSEADKIVALPAPRTELDIPIESDIEQYWEPESFQQGIARLADDIDAFKRRDSLKHVVVVYVGSPHRPGERALVSVRLETLIRSGGSDILKTVPTGLLYAVASIRAGASFVDFTPSETLETVGLLDYALSEGVQMAGRDGSTGQTMLKLAIAQMLYWRNINIEGWFSDNLIGNHDGYVLNLPGHSETKLRDKKEALQFQPNCHDVDHLVRINYFPFWGDRKESWDAIECSGWMGNQISLRLNWRAGDSLLAAPMILDIVRLLEYGFRNSRIGLQKQLAFFFKRPIGMESSTLAERFRLLCDSYGART